MEEFSSKIAFLCSGQGSQYTGMGKELYDAFPEARAVYQCASDILGMDIAKLSFEGPEEALAPTRVSQPAIFALSMAAHAVVKQFCQPGAYAGHSLGEYAALTAAGAFTLEDGFRLIGIRAAAMQKASEESPGAMYAIVGSDEDTVAKVCADTPGYVLPVNFNAVNQTVIAGETEAAAKAAQVFTDMGVKAVKLAVSSGFHSKLMAGAAEELFQKLDGIPVRPLEKPFYCNVTGALMPPDTDLKAYLRRHMISGVYFHREISAMLENGFTSFVELGPGKVLTMLVKRGFKQAAAMNVENLKTLEKAKQALGA